MYLLFCGGFVGWGPCASSSTAAAVFCPGRCGHRPLQNTIGVRCVERGALTLPPYNDFLSTVALHERQRRKTNRRYVIRHDNDCVPRTRGKRWQIRNRNSVQEVQKPGFLAVFLVTFGTAAKSDPCPEARNPFPRAGARNIPPNGPSGTPAPTNDYR